MSWPKVYPAPRGEMPQPPRSSGSDHSRSHMGPYKEYIATAYILATGTSSVLQVFLAFMEEMPNGMKQGGMEPNVCGMSEHSNKVK